jgi:hypothetical protein
MTFGEFEIVHGDVLATLRELPDNSFDALLCDPPYGFRFMGKKWDYDVPSVEVWREALRVLKPGGALLAFGGARTFHRIASGIEDAGFELRDCLMWLYAKGFPKSQNVGLAIDKAAGAERPVLGTRVLTGNAAISTKEKGGTYGVQVGSIPPKEVAVTGPATALAQQWDGYGTALKPAHEPIILARKPLDGTMVKNVGKWGCGPLAIDACRLERDPDDVSGYSKTGSKASENVAMSGGNYAREPKPDADGRWPANLCLDEDAAAVLDAEVGNRPSRKSVTRNGGGNQGGAVYTGRTGTAKPDSGRKENGGPSRFFKVTECDSSNPECASTAARLTDLARRLSGIALTDVAQLPALAASLSTFNETSCRAHRISATPNAFVERSENDTRQIQSSAERCLRELKRIEGYLIGLVSSAGPKSPIDITKTTRDLLMCISYVESVISECTPLSLEPGGWGSAEALRFKFSAKVSTKEREFGCEALPLRSAAAMTDSSEDAARLASPRAGAGRGGGARNHHVTLKPIALTKWLASLIKPPTADATLLIPYCGAGSEIIGALQAGWPLVFGIEGDVEYVEIAKARIAAWGSKADEGKEAA